MPYLPFGEGPRSCIAVRLAKMITKIGIILVLKDFNFELAGNTLKPPKIDPKSFLLTPLDGLELKVTKRRE